MPSRQNRATISKTPNVQRAPPTWDGDEPQMDRPEVAHGGGGWTSVPDLLDGGAPRKFQSSLVTKMRVKGVQGSLWDFVRRFVHPLSFRGEAGCGSELWRQVRSGWGAQFKAVQACHMKQGMARRSTAVQKEPLYKERSRNIGAAGGEATEIPGRGHHVPNADASTSEGRKPCPGPHN